MRAKSKRENSRSRFARTARREGNLDKFNDEDLLLNVDFAFSKNRTDTMSDLIRTIESDDEDLQVSAPASTSTAVLDTKKRKREGGEQKALVKAGKKDSKKQGKGKAAEQTDVKGKGKLVEDAEAIAGEFQFDAMGGGEYLSRGARQGDAWVCAVFCISICSYTYLYLLSGRQRHVSALQEAKCAS